uniref:Tetratricopeptide repeat domain 21A n=1 Tax=Callorhinchus milii TaxID=7868 RepID=A0A4W3IEV3_CALMI
VQSPDTVYYCQEKYFHHVLNIVHKEMQVYNNEPLLLFFKGFAVLMEGKVRKRANTLISESEAPPQDFSVPPSAHHEDEVVSRSAELGANSGNSTEVGERSKARAQSKH